MEQFKIESGIPVSDVMRNGKTSTPKYPFASMNVGDSFFIKADNVYQMNKGSWGDRSYTNPTASSLTYHTQKYKKEVNDHKQYKDRVNFTYRKVEGGFRCWRTK